MIYDFTWTVFWTVGVSWLERCETLPKPKDSWLVQQAEALVEQSESVTIDSRKSRDSELIYECS